MAMPIKTRADPVTPRGPTLSGGELVGGVQLRATEVCSQ